MAPRGTATASVATPLLQASRRRALAFIAVALVLALCARAVPRRAGPADPQPPRTAAGAASPAVPQECMDAGLALQNKCTMEFQMGLTAFGVDPDAITNDPSAVKIDTAQLKAFLDKADPPSLPCCEAITKFNNKYCSCSPAVLDLVVSFTNDDLDQYRILSRYFESKCKAVSKPFTLYMDNTCPPKTK